MLTLFTLALACAADPDAVRVGSKAFTEGYLLGELAAQVIELKTGRATTRTFGLGTTGVTLEALRTDQIDLYPEYTGTLAEAVLHDGAERETTERNPAALAKALRERGFVLSAPLGFENTYALAVRADFARRFGLKTITDLKRVKEPVRYAFSHEFVSRADGAAALSRAYGIEFAQNLQSIDHALAYEAIAHDRADVIAAYSTDARVRTLDLVTLDDDRRAFPPYRAVFVAKADFVTREPAAWAALNELNNTLNESTMRRLNGEVDREHRDVAEVIARHLKRPGAPARGGWWPEVRRRTVEHLQLVGLAFVVSILAGVPLGIYSARRRRLGQAVLVFSAVVQTIPSLALLALLIPVFGIGTPPALVALCLYSLLPVVLNTLVGLDSVDPSLTETARALGLNPRQILLSVELPLAAPAILAGLRTATIIGIGTATLAALIGAGGYGAPIVSGLATNDVRLIFSGAVPCAVMALVVYAGFGLVERWTR